MRALLLPLALLVACGTPATSDAPAFSATLTAPRSAHRSPWTSTPPARLVWSVVEAPEGSALWALPTHEGETFTLTPDVAGDLLLSVERCDAEGCVWGEVVIFARGWAFAGQAGLRGWQRLGRRFDPLPDVNDDFDPLPD
jgi:hypothetical protein